MTKCFTFMKVKVGLDVFKLAILSFILLGAPTLLWSQNNATPIQNVQEILVSGTIRDSKGETIIGANVLVRGTTIGTVTDIDGNFSFKAPVGSELLVSFIGYTSQTFIASASHMNIVLEDELEMLNDVVVIGYGTVKKRDLTGSVVSVKSDDITMAPVANPVEALQGKVAGFDITRTSGQAGSGVNMQLRGSRSIYGSNEPLFIIDGMPGDYSSLNTNDIESIDVLKDASSTAIYGSAGANGVVIITTKKAQAGRPVVNFNAYYGYNGFASFPKSRTGESYLNLRREAARTAGTWSSTADDASIFSTAEYDAIQKDQWVDWSDQLMHDGYIQNYSLSVSGGSENTKAYFSFNLSDEKGIYKNDNNKIYSIHSTIDQKIYDWVSAGVDLNLSYTDQNARKGVLNKALTAVPLGVAYDEEGNINQTPIAGSSAYGPMSDEIDGAYKNQNKNTHVTANSFIMIEPIKGLSLKSVLGVNLSDSRTGKFNSELSLDNELLGYKSASVNNGRSYNYKWENILNYNFTISEHNFALTGVTSWNHNQSESLLASAINVPYDKFLFHNLASGSTSARSSYSMTKGMSYVARVNYNYLGRYLLSVSNRWDGSSRLSEEKKWDQFPAAAVAWRLSDEAFMQSATNYISNLKIRVGYGVTGNSSSDVYGTVASAETGTLSFGNTVQNTYYNGQTLDNSDLGWEKSYSTNVGVDLGFVNNRISLTADWYNTDTKDILYKRAIPTTSGGYLSAASYMWQNICETNNKGIELSLNTRNIDGEKFTWSSNITFAHNKEKVTKLVTDEDIIDGDGILSIGQPISTFYNYKFDGIWQTSEIDEAALYGKTPGDIKLVDVTHTSTSGVETTEYTTADKTILGSASPDWTMGFLNNFTYRSFDLSLFLYARWGQMINYEAIGTYDPQGISNSPDYFNYWTPENPSNDLPRPNSTKKLSSYFGYESLNYVDGSYFKIKNITLGYTLPTDLLNKIHLSKLRVYGTVSNPFVFAKSDMIDDYDPELGGSTKFPLTKQIVFGVNVTF